MCDGGNCACCPIWKCRFNRTKSVRKLIWKIKNWFNEVIS